VALVPWVRFLSPETGEHCGMLLKPERMATKSVGLLKGRCQEGPANTALVHRRRMKAFAS
jgi:hypothetical protein